MSRVITAEFRRRAAKPEDVESLHGRLLEGVTSALTDWLGAISSQKIYFEGAGTEGAADITPALRSGVRAAISYAPRKMINSDRACFDDVLTIQIPSKSELYRSFATRTFEALVQAFEAYRAKVDLDEEMSDEDFNHIVTMCETTGRDCDGRDGVFRIPPLAFWDRELCTRAFSMPPSSMAECLDGHVISREFLDGVLILGSPEVLKREELIHFDQTVRRILGDAETA